MSDLPDFLIGLNFTTAHNKDDDDWETSTQTFQKAFLDSDSSDVGYEVAEIYKKHKEQGLDSVETLGGSEYDKKISVVQHILNNVYQLLRGKFKKKKEHIFDTDVLETPEEIAACEVFIRKRMRLLILNSLFYDKELVDSAIDYIQNYYGNGRALSTPSDVANAYIDAKLTSDRETSELRYIQSPLEEFQDYTVKTLQEAERASSQYNAYVYILNSLRAHFLNLVNDQKEHIRRYLKNHYRDVGSDEFLLRHFCTDLLWYVSLTPELRQRKEKEIKSALEEENANWDNRTKEINDFREEQERKRRRIDITPDEA